MQSRDARSYSRTARLNPVTLGLVAGLTVGLVDISLAIVGRPPSFASFLNIFPPVAATALFAFVIALGGTLITIPLRGLSPRWENTVSPAVATFIVVLLIFLDYGHTAPFVRNPYRILIALALSAAVGWMVLVRPGHVKRTVRFVVALPFGLLAATCFHWLIHYNSDGALSSRGILFAFTGFITVVAVSILAAFLYRFGGRLIGGLLVVIVLVAGAKLSLEKPRTYNSDGFRPVRHVILLVIDTLRADMIRCQGEAAPPTPNIDNLASDCVRFSHAMSPSPWTMPAMVSLMTGLAPEVHGALAKNSRVPDGLTTLAEYMKAAGYVTGASVDNPYLSAKHGMDAGFDEFIHYPRNTRDTSFGTLILQRLFPKRYRDLSSTDVTAAHAIEFIERHSEKNFFLWTHIFDPHIAYGPPERFQPKGTPPSRIGRRFGSVKEIRLGMLYPTPGEKEWIRKLYEGEVRYVDEAVGKIIQTLRAEGIYDDALIVLVSDHGEEFFEHGGIEHGHTLYDELLRVPLMVKLPGAAGKRVVEEPVSTQRVMATILGTCGIAPGDAPSDGAETLIPAEPTEEPKDTEETEYDPVFGTGCLYFEPRESVVLDGYKYIRGLDTGVEELYDLERDPAETKNVVDEQQRRVTRARAALDAHAEACELLKDFYNTRNSSRIELDEDTIQRLKSLGYL